MSQQHGKTRIVNPTTAQGAAGFRCDLCDATFPAYEAFVEHCNGRLHQRNLGAAPVERVDDVARIKARLQLLREKTRRKRGATGPEVEEHVEARIAQRRLEEEQQRRAKYEKRKAAKAAASKPQEPEDDEAKLMASMMGFSSFK